MPLQPEVNQLRLELRLEHRTSAPYSFSIIYNWFAAA
jgi:hypothetical protein